MPILNKIDFIFSYYFCNMKPIRRYGRCLKMILTRTASRVRNSRTRTIRTIRRTVLTTAPATAQRTARATAARITTKQDPV